MRNAALGTLIIISTVFAGCVRRAQTTESAATNLAESDGIAVIIETPKRSFSPGEQFDVKVVVGNIGDEPQTLVATSSAPVYLRLMRHYAFGWEEIKRYPETAAKVVNRWTLQPGQSREFILRLKVEPDWPRDELLRLAVELNGFPQSLQPGVTIEVLSKK